MSVMSLEQVYCLAAETLPAPGPQVLPLSAELYKQLATTGSFLPRREVEDNERWRQIIPYAVIEQGEQVLLVERLKAGSEARLHRLLSIGLGGHINPVDHANARDPIEAALARELREELHIRAFFAEAVGLIHRQENAVERVHSGILYRVKPKGEIAIRETEKLAGQLVPWSRADELFTRLEGWSQAALRFLQAPLNKKEKGE